MPTDLRALVLIVVAGTGVALAACDTQATASDPRGGAPRGDQLSREHESCAASVHCAPGLRCLEQICQRTDRSVLGDYAAALGQLARSRGETDAAIALYAEAIGRYEADALAVPADIDCAYGDVLTTAKVNKERAELAARVLHRCLVAAPAAGPLRTRALADLAELFETGLDPIHLARTAPADLYLTRTAQRPDPAALKVTASAEPAPTGKTFPNLLARFGEADLRAPLVACWDAYYAATRKSGLAVQVPLRGKLVASQYDDEPDRLTVTVEGAPPTGSTPEATAALCVRAAVEPALKDLKTVREPFTTTLTVRVQ
jgi:hypothetical protein